MTYLEEEKMTLEGQIELVEEYQQRKGDSDYDEFARAEGLTELSNLEISFGIKFLKKRIASLETQIEKEAKEVA
jgi:hypothetical protein